jgi:hypothetical protein
MCVCERECVSESVKERDFVCVTERDRERHLADEVESAGGTQREVGAEVEGTTYQIRQ